MDRSWTGREALPAGLEMRPAQSQAERQEPAALQRKPSTLAPTEPGARGFSLQPSHPRNMAEWCQLALRKLAIDLQLWWAGRNLCLPVPARGRTLPER